MRVVVQAHTGRVNMWWVAVTRPMQTARRSGEAVVGVVATPSMVQDSPQGHSGTSFPGPPTPDQGVDMAPDDIDLSGTRVAGLGSEDTKSSTPAGSTSAGGPAPSSDSGGRSAGTYLALILAVVAIGFLVSWVARNRETVSVDWLFGTTNAPLAVAIFVAAALGWVAGMATVPLVRWRRRHKQ